MSGYNITGWSGGGRRPLTYNLKAGQFRGMGRVNVIPSQTTIINNNIIGGGTFATQCYDTGTPKWLNWMLPIGLGTSLIGGILNMFGIGGGGGTVEGAGGKEEPQTRTETKTPDPTQSQEYKDLNKKLDKALDEIAELKKQSQAYQAQQQEDVTPKTVTPKVQQEQEEQPDYSFIKNGAKMVCRDASGRTQNIAGTLSNVQTDANGVPQSFTLTDDTSNNQYKYEVRVGSDGTLTYECVSKNGDSTIGAPTYTLENGQLVNKEGQNGFSQGIRTQRTSAPTQTTQTQTTPTSQNQIKTLADGTMVSDNFTAVTPYEHSDGKYYSKEEAITPWGKYAQQKAQTATTQNTNNQQKLSYEAEQYFNEHPYTIKDFGGRKTYVSDDGKLMANSEQQLWDMIENNNNIAKMKGATTNNTTKQEKSDNIQAKKNLNYVTQKIVDSTIAKINDLNISQPEKAKLKEEINNIINNSDNMNTAQIQSSLFEISKKI